MSQPTESYVQVATDGSGKRMRNLLRYVTQPDGTVQPVYEEAVQIVDPDGSPVDFGTLLTDLSRGIMLLSEVLKDTQPSGLDLVPRVWSQTTLPPKAGPYNASRMLGDAFGRQIIVPHATRDMVTTQTTTISASTSETTILTGVPGFFLDPFLIIVSNTSAATSTRLDFRDATAGTILFSLQSVGGGSPVGFSLPIPIPQTTAGGNWTVTCGTSTTDIRVYTVAVKNR